MVAASLVKITLLVLQLYVPALLHVPLAPFRVNCADATAFKMPDACIVKVLISFATGNVGE